MYNQNHKLGGPKYAKLPGSPSSFKRDFKKFGSRAVKIYRTDQNVVDTGVAGSYNMGSGSGSGMIQGGVGLGPGEQMPADAGGMDWGAGLSGMAQALGKQNLQTQVPGAPPIVDPRLRLR